MRRPATTLIALLASAALLTGCSNGATPEEPEPTDAATDPTGQPTPSAEDVAALDAVTVTGDTGAAAEVDFDQPFSVSAPVARLDVAGTGEDLEAGRTAFIHLVAFSGDDGSVLGSTWDSGSRGILSVGDPSNWAVLNDLLDGQKVGTRFLFAVPGSEGSEATDSAAAVQPTPSVIQVVEITDLVPTRAAGAAVTPPEGLPTVTLDGDGAPSIDIPADAVEPTALVAQTLIEGDGAEIESGQTALFHYSGWLWDGTPFDSSWQRGKPFETPIGVGRVIAGWDEGLVGKTIGSQVLLVVPADKGYGETGQGSIPGGATLIFVVDLLAVI